MVSTIVGRDDSRPLIVSVMRRHRRCLRCLLSSLNLSGLLAVSVRPWGFRVVGVGLRYLVIRGEHVSRASTRNNRPGSCTGMFPARKTVHGHASISSPVHVSTYPSPPPYSSIRRRGAGPCSGNTRRPKWAEIATCLCACPFHTTPGSIR